MATTVMRRVIVLAGILSFLVAFSPASATAQPDHNAGDRRNNIENDIFIPAPSKAAMLSATLPGLGQVYNRKYWKVPIIYAGFGTLVYFVNFNNTEYRMWREAWIARVDGNPNTVDDFPLHSTDVLERAMNYYRRNLEITYILSVALYMLNILDASVDAHLMNFDISEELSFGMQPCIIPSATNAGVTTKSAQITLRIRL